MKVINLWGSPGAGKSTTAAGLFYKMKVADYNVELINEFAKEVTWEGHNNLFKDQLYILGQQNRKLERLRGKVDYVITDSPLLLTLAYTPKDYYEGFRTLVENVWESYDNYNHLVLRTHAYKQVGRHHSEDESHVVDKTIQRLSEDYNLNMGVSYNTEKAVDTIFEKVINNDL